MPFIPREIWEDVPPPPKKVGSGSGTGGSGSGGSGGGGSGSGSGGSGSGGSGSGGGSGGGGSQEKKKEDVAEKKWKAFVADDEKADKLMYAKQQDDDERTSKTYSKTGSPVRVAMQLTAAEVIPFVGALLQGVMLDVIFDIDLTAQGPTMGYTDWRGWMFRREANGTYSGAERINQAFWAAMDTANAIGQESSQGLAFGISQTRQSFGNTEFRLTEGRFSRDPEAYASTYVDPASQRGLIYFYTDPARSGWLQEDINRGYVVQGRENIVHEFGHILLGRTDDVSNGYFPSWDSVLNEFGDSLYPRGFAPQLGWGNPALRQHRPEEHPQFGQGDRVVGARLVEDERLADMFLFWVYGDGRSNREGYYFDIVNSSLPVADRAVAMDNFMQWRPTQWQRETGSLAQLSTPGMYYWLLWAEMPGDLPVCYTFPCPTYE